MSYREDVRALVAGSAVVALMVLTGIVVNVVLVALSPDVGNPFPWMSAA
jgi:hypothetical protein